ncbi:6,7-dimethyl-8-ribityllumazine synthase [Salinispirillum marinum]|uniref:6,7-dimethyl-8-ribityllumazine synthase n=2 Tax=Saccharospirillaceae TaxID=255527 RepID=A0ABV8BFI2_9GAMM
MNQHTEASLHPMPSTVEPQKIAVISASWHKPIVHNAIQSIKSHFDQNGVHGNDVEFFEVPGAFEIPLHAKMLAKSGRFKAVIACAFVVNSGIYRHEYVASSVIDGLMKVQLTTDIPVFSAVLTPHNFHEHEDHLQFFANHFLAKGAEVAQACLETLKSLSHIRKLHDQ